MFFFREYTPVSEAAKAAAELIPIHSEETCPRIGCNLPSHRHLSLQHAADAILQGGNPLATSTTVDNLVGKPLGISRKHVLTEKIVQTSSSLAYSLIDHGFKSVSFYTSIEEARLDLKNSTFKLDSKSILTKRQVKPITSISSEIYDSKGKKRNTKATLRDNRIFEVYTKGIWKDVKPDKNESKAFPWNKPTPLSQSIEALSLEASYSGKYFCSLGPFINPVQIIVGAGEMLSSNEDQLCESMLSSLSEILSINSEVLHKIKNYSSKNESILKILKAARSKKINTKSINEIYTSSRNRKDSLTHEMKTLMTVLINGSSDQVPKILLDMFILAIIDSAISVEACGWKGLFDTGIVKHDDEKKKNKAKILMSSPYSLLDTNSCSLIANEIFNNAELCEITSCSGRLTTCKAALLKMASSSSPYRGLLTSAVSVIQSSVRSATLDDSSLSILIAVAISKLKSIFTIGVNNISAKMEEEFYNTRELLEETDCLTLEDFLINLDNAEMVRKEMEKSDEASGGEPSESMSKLSLRKYLG